jgi:hypothetical protein
LDDAVDHLVLSRPTQSAATPGRGRQENSKAGCRHLDLSQYLQPGQELEVPTERLSQYDLQGPLPDAAKALVKLQVLTPDWKHQGQIVICSRVTVAAPPAPESPC